MRTFKFAPTLLAFALVLASQYAHAWKSPQQAVDEFLKFELDGGRMQPNYAGEKYLISPPAEEVNGKKSTEKTIALVKEYKVMAFLCAGKACTVKVKFWFAPSKAIKNGTQTIEAHAEGDSRLVSYTVRRIDNSWLIENDLGIPLVSEDTFKRTTQSIIPTSGRGK